MYQKLWHSRLNRKKEYPLVEDFNASIKWDQFLVDEEIVGNLAYAKALQQAGIFNKKELKAVLKQLHTIRQQIRKGKINLNKAEDIHTAIEIILTKRLGKIGRKLHTGRSRNEQVVLAERLYLKKEIKAIIEELIHLQKIILKQAENYLGIIMPGYTHLQQAQPILFSHYLMALFFMLQRDKERLLDSLKRIDFCPLGSGALAGNTYNINRRFLAKELEFNKISENSLDATSDRDFIVEFLSASSIIMMHLSRFCEDLIIWSSQEFGFVALADELCSSSSLMPQKKNPDSLELIRAKSGRIFGYLLGLLTVLKGLPMGYNKDMQEDKIPLYDTVQTIKSCLKIFGLVLQTMHLKPERMIKAINDFTLSTNLVDYLVAKGISFQDSHAIIGKVVRYALEHNKSLKSLSLNEFKRFSPKFQNDVYEVLNHHRSIQAHNQQGGTSKKMVQKQIKIGWQYLK